MSKFIALVGAVGVGKTFYGTQIKDTLPSCLFIEEAVSNNIYLNDFYSNMKKWGFHSRISMLSMIVSNTPTLNTDDNYVIVDRCVQELIVFATKEFEDGNMTEKEYSLYLQLYTGVLKFLPEPDLYVYFYCSAKTSFDRIKARGRECEKNVTYEFCQDVCDRYSKWINTIPRNKVVFVDTEKPQELSHIVSLIKQG